MLALPTSREDMAPGGPEEQALMSSPGLAIPPAAAVRAERWVLVDKTCQILFAGESGNGVAFVFATSTGEPGYETRGQDAVRAFRFDPALDNAGWHNSSTFPVPEDNALNGNMYKPIYFDDGQAIHGANNVPPEPRSKGCVRLRVENQDALVAWLGLADENGSVWDSGEIDLRVSVQGDYAVGA